MTILAPQSQSRSRPDYRRTERAFTLIEMLVVLAIMGMIVAMALPKISGLGKGNIAAAATRKLMDDLMYARLKAISGRTKVYVMFMPEYRYLSFGRAQGSYVGSIPGSNDFLFNLSANKIASSQMIGYTIFADRSVGDQPGQKTPKFITDWEFLPEGTHIPHQVLVNPNIFLNVSRLTAPNSANDVAMPIFFTNKSATYYLPCIGFDTQGRLIGRSIGGTNTNDVIIPLFEGAINFPPHASPTYRDRNDVLTVPAVNTAKPVPNGEIIAGQIYTVAGPSGNTNSVTYRTALYRDGDVFTGQNTTNYTVVGGAPQLYLVNGVRLDKLTGRARMITPKL
jgi:prepilin-type N-terminal cleavage/methylation domain-containing protein